MRKLNKDRLYVSMRSFIPFRSICSRSNLMVYDMTKSLANTITLLRKIGLLLVLIYMNSNIGADSYYNHEINI